MARDSAQIEAKAVQALVGEEGLRDLHTHGDCGLWIPAGVWARGGGPIPPDLPPLGAA